MKILILFLILIVLFSGCTQKHSTPVPTEQLAKDFCIQICQSFTEDLNNGPCLSDDHPNWIIDDWVCDVAHSPRQDVDNLPENQCQSYREGKASHFVEVDINCNLIKAV